jgi:glucose-6-phosphate 1-epimerase
MSTGQQELAGSLSNYNSGIHHIHWLDRDAWLIVQSWGLLVVAKLGAQVLHYQPTGQRSVFWVNTPLAQSVNEAARGGAPLCWPWFGPHSSDPNQLNHGTARTALWKLNSLRLEENNGGCNKVTSLEFIPASKISTTFEVVFEVVISANDLTMKIITRNITDQAQSLTQAIHSYFNVGNSEEIIVKGLKGCDYLDKLADNKLSIQRQQLSNISAIDSIYKHQGEVVIVDKSLTREIIITKAGSGSTVVWNPGANAKCYSIEQGQKAFICVEAANTAHENLTVEPREKVELLQRVQLRLLP